MSENGIEYLKKVREGCIIQLQKDQELLKNCSNKDRSVILWRIKQAKSELKKLNEQIEGKK